jgi:hypothetical protein
MTVFNKLQLPFHQKNIMKNIISLLAMFLILLALCPVESCAQSGWTWQNPLPQGNNLSDIYVFDQNIAIGVGKAGTVMKTIDGGINWNIQCNAGGAPNYLNSIHFIDANTGWFIQPD